MGRAFVLLMDSFGIGASEDAERYGDSGASTLGGIANSCAAGLCDEAGLRKGTLYLPTLSALGLGHIAEATHGQALPGLTTAHSPTAVWGYAAEQSLGKDTPSGHWEIAGVPVNFEWGYFHQGSPAFPKQLIDKLIEEANLSGVLGDCHASGTEIIMQHGEEHMRSGKPIVYTSADSVFQIAAHEDSFGLERLYEICAIARRLVDEYNIGRVIARPFKGEIGNFYRTGNRRDLAVLPPAPTLLDYVKEAGREVIAVGKVADIYAHQGVTQVIKADGNDALFSKTFELQKTAPEGSLVFTNFVDFDMLYGHRRDIKGYAKALETFDTELANFIKNMREDDVAVITADHGCDPTRPGSDHTREFIPILFFGPKISAKAIGRRDTFADIGQTLAKHLAIKPLTYGTAFY